MARSISHVPVVLSVAQCNGDQTDLYSHTTTIFAVAWSPRGDLIATGAAGGEIRLWNTAAKRVQKILRDHQSDVNELVFSPDGRLLVSCGDDLTLRIWQVDLDEPPRVLRGVTLSDLNGLAFSPDGRWLAAGGEDQKARVWDTSSWQLIKVLSAGNGAINRMTFSADSRRIAISQSSGLGTVFDFETGEALLTLDPKEEPQRRMGAISFSHDDRFLATASIEAQAIHFWNAETGELLRSLHSEGNWIHSMAFSPDDRRLITGHQDGALRIWDVATLEGLQVLLGHTEVVRDLAISPHGDLVASAGADGLVKTWDLAAIEHRRTRLNYPKLVRTVAFSPSQELFAFEERQGPVRLVDADSLAVVFQSAVSREDGNPSLAFSSNGELLAYAIGDGRSIEIVDVAARLPIAHLAQTTGRFRNIAFMPNSDILATGDEQSTLTFWDVKSGKALRGCSTDQGTILAIAFFARGDQVVIAAHKDVRVWDARTLERGTPLDAVSKKVIELAVSPDGTLLAGASSGGEVLVWDLAERRLRRLLVGHRAWSNSVNFSPDGKTLASAGDDGTIRLWDVRTLQEVGVMVANKDRFCRCHSVAFSPDGLTLVAGGNGPQERGELFIFSAASRRLGK